MPLPRTAPTEARKSAVVEVVRVFGMTGPQAALSVGVSRSTYYQWCEDDGDFLPRIAEAEAQWEKRTVGNIARLAVEQRSWRGLLALLERRLPWWMPRQTVDLHVDEHRSREDALAERPDAELQARLAELLDEAAHRLERTS